MHQSGSERTRPIRFASGAAALAFCLVAIQIPIAFGAINVESLEGSAYGAYASIDLGPLQGTLGAIPSVALPADGGEVSKTATSVKLIVGLTEFVDLDALEVYSTGAGVGGSEGDVRSVATVDGTELLGGIIHADQVIATCNADSTGSGGTVTLVGASVAGVGPLQVSPAPNTGVSIPGVGTLVLNEQTIGSDGSLTVNGLSLDLLPALGTGTVNIARAVCGLETSVASTPTTSPSSPSTTLSPSPTEPAPTTTTAPGGPTTTSPGPATTTSSAATAPTVTPGESTTPPAQDESATNPSDNTAEITGSAITGTESGNEASKGETDSSEAYEVGNPFADSERRTTAAGPMIGGSGGPPAPGQASMASNAVPDVIPTSPDWPTLVDLTILGALLAAVGMLIDWRKVDLRRIIGRSHSGN